MFLNVISDLRTIENAPPCAVALGMFDGVHRGHRKVIQAAIDQSDLETAVLTFTTTYQRPKKKLGQRDILTISGRLKVLEQLPVQTVYLPSFEQLQLFSPKRFVEDILQNTLHAKVVCCGEDFRFGRNASGDVTELKRLGALYGIKVIVVEPELDRGQPISSTRIRSSLIDGDIASVNRLLGYCYFIEGKVVYGQQLGRTIQCPTINQELDERICIPKFGVYISTTSVDGIVYPSITNIGKKPTIAGDRQPLAETHVIGIDRQMYGEILRVKLYQFIRGEERFDSIAELSHYIQRDIQTAKNYFKCPKLNVCD